jgi:NAD(P)-dependent dehydrogenase (short-subunit alcohol dehydrogenase family)
MTTASPETLSAREIFSLKGHTALITGASSGLGLTFAQVLHEAGARVILAARREDRLTAEAARLGEAALAVRLDVADAASIHACFAELAARGVVADIVVNNAGIAAPGPALDLAVEDWDAVMAVNLRGAFLVAREAARHMIAAGRGGSIINIASILGLRVIANLASYTAAKAGLLHLTRSLAIELARHQIRVNALAPGYVETAINAGFFATPPGQAMIKRIPQRRLGQPRDLAGPLLLLASEAGAHMTGATLVVDGGHSINSV